VMLPHQRIIPVRRAESSGDTFIFTQFLDFSAENWENHPGYGSSIAWPNVAGEKTATGNEGLIQALAANPYAIGYVGISYADQVAKAGLGTAMVENQAGKFLLPTAQSIADAAAELDPRTPPYERISLVYAPGDNSYPLINYEYAVVSKSQPDSATADALRDFLRWAIAATGGNDAKYLGPVGFIPLPDFVRGLSEAQIKQIK
jgi:phosphate transport system substrate-binding protein